MTIVDELFQGKVENNMPAFLLLPPTSFAVEQPQMKAALLANADGLTSHLDLYVTLRELLAIGSKESLVEPTRGGTSSSSSYHLFIDSGFPGKSLLHPVERRVCATAGVPPQVFPRSWLFISLARFILTPGF